MNPKIVLTFCVVLIAGLLYIERRWNPVASYALWIPTFWMFICGSRPVGRWFKSDPLIVGATRAADGSPIDRLVLAVFILLALLVLSRRKLKWSRLFKDIFWLILLYLYMGLSILWSDFPFVSFKRWIKVCGTIPMAFVVLTEREPFQAMESIFRRCAYVLIPFSLLINKYFSNLGRAYNRWTGKVMYVGVTTHKNSLGQLCAICLLFIIWTLLKKWRSGGLFKTSYQTFADIFVSIIALYMLYGIKGSYSATSRAIFIVGTVMFISLYRMKNLARNIAKHLKAIVAALILIFLSLYETLVQTVAPLLGREETLTGRTHIWDSLLDIASQNPLLGVGYGGFWRLKSSTFNVGQSHNGYLEVYLNIGIFGIVLLSGFLIAFCYKVRREINYSFDWGTFGLCYVLILLLYNFTESSFIILSYIWSNMVLLTVVLSEPCLHTN